MNNTGSLLENRVLTLDQATPGAGPIGPAIDKRLSPRSETYLTLDHNIRTKTDNSFLPIINAQDETSQQYVNDKYVNFTGREQIMPTVVEQTNLKGHEEFQKQRPVFLSVKSLLIIPHIPFFNRVNMQDGKILNQVGLGTVFIRHLS